MTCPLASCRVTRSGSVSKVRLWPGAVQGVKTACWRRVSMVRVSLVQERVGESLLSPERAAGGQLGGEHADARPPLEPAVRVEDEIQQVIHVRLLVCPLPQRPGGVVWPEPGRLRRRQRQCRGSGRRGPRTGWGTGTGSR